MESSPAKITHLGEETKAMVKTTMQITTVTQCIEELILNALDASATSIAVRVDLTQFKIQVIDNGLGMTASQLNQLGRRKICKEFESSDLNIYVKRFGFRGESIVEIMKVSESVFIISRAAESNKTFCRRWKVNEQNERSSETSQQRAARGSTIIIQGLFFNQPIRQKLISPTIELNHIKRLITQIALVHPHVSFSLRDDRTKTINLEIKRNISVKENFCHLYPEIPKSSIIEVKAKKEGFEINGIISRNIHTKNSLQFVFVNNRVVLDTFIQKHTNYLLSKSFYLKGISHKNENSNSRCVSRLRRMKKSENSKVQNSKQEEKHAIFLISINCPKSEYTASFYPKSTLIEFLHGEIVVDCLELAIQQFLEAENYFMNVDCVRGNDLPLNKNTENKHLKKSSISAQVPVSANEVATRSFKDQATYPIQKKLPLQIKNHKIIPQQPKCCLETNLLKKKENVNKKENKPMSTSKLNREAAKILNHAKKLTITRGHDIKIDNLSVSQCTESRGTVADIDTFDVPGSVSKVAKDVIIDDKKNTKKNNSASKSKILQSRRNSESILTDLTGSCDLGFQTITISNRPLKSKFINSCKSDDNIILSSFQQAGGCLDLDASKTSERFLDKAKPEKFKEDKAKGEKFLQNQRELKIRERCESMLTDLTGESDLGFQQTKPVKISNRALKSKFMKSCKRDDDIISSRLQQNGGCIDLDASKTSAKILDEAKPEKFKEEKAAREKFLPNKRELKIRERCESILTDLTGECDLGFQQTKPVKISNRALKSKFMKSCKRDDDIISSRLQQNGGCIGLDASKILDEAKPEKFKEEKATRGKFLPNKRELKIRERCESILTNLSGNDLDFRRFETTPNPNSSLNSNPKKNNCKEKMDSRPPLAGRRNGGFISPGIRVPGEIFKTAKEDGMNARKTPEKISEASQKISNFRKNCETVLTDLSKEGDSNCLWTKPNLFKHRELNVSKIDTAFDKVDEVPQEALFKRPFTLKKCAERAKNIEPPAAKVDKRQNSLFKLKCSENRPPSIRKRQKIFYDKIKSPIPIKSLRAQKLAEIQKRRQYRSHFDLKRMMYEELDEQTRRMNQELTKEHAKKPTTVKKSTVENSVDENRPNRTDCGINIKKQRRKISENNLSTAAKISETRNSRVTYSEKIIKYQAPQTDDYSFSINESTLSHSKFSSAQISKNELNAKIVEGIEKLEEINSKSNDPEKSSKILTTKQKTTFETTGEHNFIEYLSENVSRENSSSEGKRRFEDKNFERPLSCLIDDFSEKLILTPKKNKNQKNNELQKCQTANIFSSVWLTSKYDAERTASENKIAKAEITLLATETTFDDDFLSPEEEQDVLNTTYENSYSDEGKFDVKDESIERSISIDHDAGLVTVNENQTESQKSDTEEIEEKEVTTGSWYEQIYEDSLNNSDFVKDDFPPADTTKHINNSKTPETEKELVVELGNEVVGSDFIIDDWRKLNLINGKLIFVHNSSGMNFDLHPAQNSMQRSKFEIKLKQNFSKTERIFEKVMEEKASRENIDKLSEKDKNSLIHTLKQFKLNPEKNNSCHVEGLECEKNYTLQKLSSSLCLPPVSRTITRGPLGKSGKKSMKCFVFDKALFLTLEVLGQLDNKFIVTIVQVDDARIVTLFDQHAVDERIRVEKLMRGYCIDFEKKVWKSVTVNPSLELTIKREHVSLCGHFITKFEKVGLYFTVNETSIIAEQVPLCLFNCAQKDNNMLRTLVMELLNEIISSLINMNGICPTVPNCILQAINEEACKRAVKFGDKLSREQAKALMEGLKSCQFPFQCAHGRPLLAPVADLNKLNNWDQIMFGPERNLRQLSDWSKPHARCTQFNARDRTLCGP